MSLSRKLKYGLLVLGFLGVSGVVIPTVGSNFFSEIFSNDLSLGGALSNLIDFSTQNNWAPKNKLGTQSSQTQATNLGIQNTPSASKVELNLESSSEKLNDFDIEEKEGVTNSIKKVYSAIETEGKVKEVEGKMEEQYLALLKSKLDEVEKKRQEYLKNFQEAKNQMSAQNSRRKRSITTVTVLNQEQRHALEKMYNLHCGLKRASEGLTLELQSKISEVDFPLALSQANGCSTGGIEEALQTIDWSKESVKTQKNRTDSKFFNSQSWGDWKDNPYRFFYDREPTWKADVRKLNQNSMKLHSIQQSIDRLNSMHLIRWGPRAQRHISEEEQKRDQLSSEMDSHIVQRVATFLLKSMGQISG